MVKQTIIIKCPFCNSADLMADYMPTAMKIKKGTWGGSQPGITRSRDSLILLVNKCPSCGKSDKDILKAYYNGKTVSHEERLKRLQDAGLPTIIENKR